MRRTGSKYAEWPATAESGAKPIPNCHIKLPAGPCRGCRLQPPARRRLVFRGGKRELRHLLGALRRLSLQRRTTLKMLPLGTPRSLASSSALSLLLVTSTAGGSQRWGHLGSGHKNDSAVGLDGTLVGVSRPQVERTKGPCAEPASAPLAGQNVTPVLLGSKTFRNHENVAAGRTTRSLSCSTATH